MGKFARGMFFAVLFMLACALALGTAALAMLLALCALIALGALYLAAPGPVRSFLAEARDTAGIWSSRCEKAAEALLRALESLRGPQGAAPAPGDPPETGTGEKNPSSAAKCG